MEFVLISIPGNMMGEYDTLFELFEKGLQTFHVRKPDFTKEQVVGVLNKIPKKYRKRVVLHGYPELVKKYELKGIHHHSQSFYLPDLGEEYTQSKSFHSIADLEQDKNPYHYTFLSPVFDSISKENYPAGFNLNDIQLPDHQQVYALGGVLPQYVATLQEKGFKGFAVLGGIWHTIVYNKLMQRFDDYINA